MSVTTATFQCIRTKPQGERQTHDRKVRVRFPADAAGEFYLSELALCADFIRCLFHPFVNAVARKRP